MSPCSYKAYDISHPRPYSSSYQPNDCTVYDLVTESTPPPRQLPYPHQTPISFNTGSFVNTSKNRKHFDGALKDKLDSSLYIDAPDFFDAFFGEIANLSSVADAIFSKCRG